MKFLGVVEDEEEGGYMASRRPVEPMEVEMQGEVVDDYEDDDTIGMMRATRSRNPRGKLSRSRMAVVTVGFVVAFALVLHAAPAHDVVAPATSCDGSDGVGCGGSGWDIAGDSGGGGGGGGAGNTSDAAGVDVWLGNGCFWERQYAYVNIEQRCALAYPTPLCADPFNRTGEGVTAVVGYAGGTRASPSGDVCYHHSGDASDGTLYSDLGHAEVVRISLDARLVERQLARLLADFFASFGSDGRRPDSMDAGPGYRSLIGVPGGADGPLFAVVEAARVAHGAQLSLEPAAGDDDDALGTVWVHDSATAPFFRGEQYHQFHSNFMPPTPYEAGYTQSLFGLKVSQGAIQPTGCWENPRGHS